ncbi:MAG: hypothetical protein K6B40_05935 [Firmicutes bacterium]|nr:hypothetical protein [Bacillota bacterium]
MLTDAQRNEKALSYPLALDVSMFTPQSALYPAAGQKLVMHMIESHLQQIEMDVPRLISRFHMSWVLLSLSIEYKTPLRPNGQYHGRTWHTSHSLPIYRREFAIYDQAEQTVAVGTMFTSLLDLQTRRICSDLNVLRHFELPDGEALLPANSRFKEEPDFVRQEVLNVRPSWLDELGHVNNSRYGEFAYDALTPAQRQNIKNLRRQDCWFMAELQSDAQLAIEKAGDEQNTIIRGLILPQNKPSFVFKLQFQP